MTAAETLNLRRTEYRMAKALLEQAIAESERSYQRLVTRLAEVDCAAARTGERLRAQRPFEIVPPARIELERRQRSSTTISVAQATAS